MKIFKACMLLVVPFFSIFVAATVGADVNLSQFQDPEVQKRSATAGFFYEWSLPGLATEGGQMPDMSGNGIGAPNLAGRLWIEYSLGPKFALVYFQKNQLDYSFIEPGQQLQFAFADPRLALRRKDQLGSLALTNDVFMQPGFTSRSRNIGRALGVGVRTNLTVSPTESRLSSGLISEMIYDFYDKRARTAPFQGFLSPWVSYSITQKLSTQHWLNLNYVYQVDAEKSGMTWDDPGSATVQNGLGMDVSDSVFASVLLNNYVFTPPTLQNTWLSVQVGLTWDYLN